MRTDKPEAEIGLYKDGVQLSYVSWLAHRQLAETIHTKLQALLDDNQVNWQDIGSLIIYKGPGSFTGLRIGFSVANALAYALQVPIVSTSSDTWQKTGLQQLAAGEDERIALPEYGALPHTTQQRK